MSWKISSFSNENNLRQIRFCVFCLFQVLKFVSFFLCENLNFLDELNLTNLKNEGKSFQSELSLKITLSKRITRRSRGFDVHFFSNLEFGFKIKLETRRVKMGRNFSCEFCNYFDVLELYVLRYLLRQRWYIEISSLTWDSTFMNEKERDGCFFRISYFC